MEVDIPSITHAPHQRHHSHPPRLQRLPTIEDITDSTSTNTPTETDVGYDGDAEAELQLPDEIEEPPSSPSSGTSSDMHPDLENMPQDEATLIKGFRNLSYERAIKDSVHLTKPAQTLKRSASQMLSTMSDSEEEDWVLPMSVSVSARGSRGASRTGTPIGIGRKRREMDWSSVGRPRAKAISNWPANWHPSGIVREAGEGTPMQMTDNEDAMEIDLLSSPLPRSEADYLRSPGSAT